MEKSIAALYCIFLADDPSLEDRELCPRKQKSLGINQDFVIKRKRPQGMIWK